MSSKSVPEASARRVSEGSVLEKVAKGGKLVDSSKAAKSGGKSGKAASAEALCGIQVKMSQAEVAARLKLLFRRYNRGASSLDAKMREESETMLNAIVEVREKFFGAI